MKIGFIFLVTVFLLPVAIFSQNVGIGTENPTAMLDINGDLVMRTAELEIADSVVTALNVNTEKFSSYRITEADSAFVLAGITSAMDGRIITLINQTGETMTLHHMDTVAEEENQIVTGNHEDFVIDDMGTVSMQYDTALMKWIVNSSNQVPAGATVWDTTVMGVFIQEFVGIGTNEPTAPLTIETPLNEIGFLHTTVNDSITVASTLSEDGGSVGTMTDHVFSLKSGGDGKVHVFPDGKVVIGQDSAVNNFIANASKRNNEFESEFTVLSDLNQSATSIIGGNNELIYDEAIGGVSAAIGTKTNHAFRLKTNNIARFNIGTDGKCWIGPGTAGADAALTIHSPYPDFGFSSIAQESPWESQKFGIIHGWPGTNSISLGTFSNDYFLLAAGGNSIMRLTPQGEVLIGEYSPFTGHPLSVKLKADSGISLMNDNSIDRWELDINSANNLILKYNYISRGSFDNTSGVYTPLSDERVKRNIKPIGTLLHSIGQLTPSTYSFKHDSTNREYIGFIAQDVEKLFPELVYHTINPAQDTDVYTMDYSGFGVLAIKGIQEQQEIIADQEKRIEKLEGTLIHSLEIIEALEKEIQLLKTMVTSPTSSR